MFARIDSIRLISRYATTIKQIQNSNFILATSASSSKRYLSKICHNQTYDTKSACNQYDNSTKKDMSHYDNSMLTDSISNISIRNFESYVKHHHKSLQYGSVIKLIETKFI